MTGSPNLDLVRSIFSAWERGDVSSSAWADPDVEFVIADGPSPSSWRGVAGMAEGGREWLAPWKEFRAEADEYRELDAERVLVLDRRGGSGKASGVDVAEMRTEGAVVFSIRSGKVTRLAIFLDRERALADLGLAPEEFPDS